MLDTSVDGRYAFLRTWELKNKTCKVNRIIRINYFFNDDGEPPQANITFWNQLVKKESTKSFYVSELNYSLLNPMIRGLEDI